EREQTFTANCRLITAQVGRRYPALNPHRFLAIKNNPVTDLVAEAPIGPGRITTYIEGNSSPRSEGISSQIGEVNGDARSALDGDGKGRLQVSEIYYTQKFGANILSLGLLDPTCRMDNSKIANNEAWQFLANAFVNNPTIAFPDYTLGACFHLERQSGYPGMNLLLTGSNGLADNPDRSYSELFDLAADGKGVFAVSEWYWRSQNSLWRLGLWLNSAETAYVDNSGRHGENYGVYLTSDHTFDHYQLNLRLGMANEKVSAASDFISLALQTRVFDRILGLALARTGVSEELAGVRDDRYQAEIYWRLSVMDGVHLSPTLQWVRNSGFDASDTGLKTDLFIYGLRASYLF
ncbi:MAG: hypothetical protein SVX28_12410, partial [Pseudomonadota bacterium]|nr:hypothetical protein [Pseudomonadota bacterium]